LERHTATVMTEPTVEPLFVPWSELSAEALHGVIEAFILREGTDYGFHEMALAEKVLQVRQQLERGDAKIIFDAETETIDIIVAHSPRR
jgi:uncharacterized protein YheU (UPF0270 family)